MPKALVTGGQGFIGNHLVAKLIDMGYEVLVIDKSPLKPTYHDNKKAVIIDADILSREVLEQSIQGVTLCFHLASFPAIGLCGRDWIFSHQNNVMGFNTLLDVLKRHPQTIKLVYASSCAVYGDAAQLPLCEDAQVIPLSNYGVDKLVNELYAQNAARNFARPSVGLRFFNVYGPGQREDSQYSGVITLFKKAILSECPLTIYGCGEQRRDFIYIDDVVEAMISAAHTPAHFSGIFNVCRGEAVSINQLAQIMLAICKSSVPIDYLKPRVGDVLNALGCPKAAEKHLGFVAKTAIKQGLEKMLK